MNKVIAARLNDLTTEIIVVNDFSNDNTRQAVEAFKELNPKETLFSFDQPENKGKGAAIHRGIKEASGDFIIVQDADLEYDPIEYSFLLQPILNCYADVVNGSRFVGSKPHRILFFWHTIGNKFLTFLSNVFTNLNITDMETCYKVFRSEIIKNISLKENRFGFEPEITPKIARIPGIGIYEVGIVYYWRTYAVGKKINWKDGFRAIWWVLKYNIWSR